MMAKNQDLPMSQCSAFCEEMLTISSIAPNSLNTADKS
jgi:hypothetical protein